MLAILPAAMPWKCPACQTQLRHDGDLPAPNRVYRCHVCHLELVLDRKSERLVAAAASTERQQEHERNT